ncbi:hypothetical protein HKX48_004929 [Thoreauomyces humboldtii]|nr:hypothetical protein HKX48_004929 [Thoreauomyces humboldtii]
MRTDKVADASNPFGISVVGFAPEIKKRLNALKNLQDKHSKVEAEFRDEVLALEKKYLLKYQPLYNQRAQIVVGAVEPSVEESTREDSSDDESDDEEEDNEEKKAERKAKKAAAAPVEAASDPSVKGVPEFWSNVLHNNRDVSELITEKDDPVLNSLTDIQFSYLDNNPGFKLEFFFAENEYFTNKSLTKTYFLEASEDASYGDVIYDRADGCVINWKEGKDLSVTVEVKKQRHKGTNKVRVVKKTVPAATFFQFFSPPKAPGPDDADVDEDELDELDHQLEADYEIGEIIKDKLIPRAVDWFTGKALEYEDDDEEFSDEDGFDGMDGDDDDEDDEGGDNGDDDVEADDGAEGAASTDKPPECKQQ